MNKVIERKSILEMENVRMHFGSGRWGFSRRDFLFVHAVDGFSISIRDGETVGLVGESGSGKTTVGRIAARLLEPSFGRVRFEGKDVTHIRGRELINFLPNVQMVFQDPFNSLNPRLSVGQIVEEPLFINKRGSKRERRQRVVELLNAVGISPRNSERYPSDFSGGQRQRIAICRALALNPKIVVCDEAVSALDVSIQAKILNLLVDLQREYHLTYLFISHDLSVVRLVSDRVVVMYLGRTVETSHAEPLFERPLHPYTQALLAAVPNMHVHRAVEPIRGEMPSNLTPPTGCPFHTRCPKRMDSCVHYPPLLVEVEPNRFVACFLYHDQIDTCRTEGRAWRRAGAVSETT